MRLRNVWLATLVKTVGLGVLGVLVVVLLVTVATALATAVLAGPPLLLVGGFGIACAVGAVFVIYRTLREE